jgi:hypothetical protein
MSPSVGVLIAAITALAAGMFSLSGILVLSFLTRNTNRPKD